MKWTYDAVLDLARQKLGEGWSYSDFIARERSATQAARAGAFLDDLKFVFAGPASFTPATSGRDAVGTISIRVSCEMIWGLVDEIPPAELRRILETVAAHWAQDILRAEIEWHTGRLTAGEAA